MKKIYLILLTIFVFISCDCTNNKQVLIMMYNTQNLVKLKSESSFQKRLINLSYVVKNSSIRQPDILVLLEVSNKEVLNSLVKEHLPEYKYNFITNYNSPMQIAVLSKYKILSANYIDSTKIIRPILHFTVSIDGKSLEFLTFHNKSQKEGFELTKENRIESARVLRKAIFEYGGKDLIILGDANIDPRIKYSDTQSISTTLINNGIISVSENPNTKYLYFPLTKDKRVEGTYYYDNTWYYLDHIYIPPSLKDNKDFIHIKSGIGYTKLLINPLGTIEKYNSNTNSGYSDHLPVWSLLEIVN